MPDEEIDGLLEMLAPAIEVGHDRIIELGCGDGKLLLRAHYYGLIPYGVDISPVALDFAEKKFTRTESCVACSAILGVEARVFDHHVGIGIYLSPMESLSMVEHRIMKGYRKQTNRDPEPWLVPDGFFHYAISYGSMEHALDIPAAVREMARVLRPDGRFLLYVPNEEWIHEDQPLETTASANEWVSLLNQCGLLVDRIKKVNDNNIIVGHKP